MKGEDRRPRRQETPRGAGLQDLREGPTIGHKGLRGGISSAKSHSAETSISGDSVLEGTLASLTTRFHRVLEVLLLPRLQIHL